MKERKLEAVGGNDDRLVDVRQEAERTERELRELSRDPVVNNLVRTRKSLVG